MRRTHAHMRTQANGGINVERAEDLIQALDWTPLPANFNNDLEGLEESTEEEIDANLTSWPNIYRQAKATESLQMFLLNKFLTLLTLIIFAQAHHPGLSELMMKLLPSLRQATLITSRILILDEFTWRSVDSLKSENLLIRKLRQFRQHSPSCHGIRLARRASGECFWGLRHRH